MRLDQIGTVFRKDLRETLRDRRTILVMVVLPILIYPVILIGATRLGRTLEQRARSREVVISVQGDPSLLAERLSEEKTPIRWLQAPCDESFEPSDDLHACVALPEAILNGAGGGEVTVRYQGSMERSSRARRLVTKALTALRSDLRAERVREAGLPLDPDHLIPVEEVDLATPERRAGRGAGKVLPFLLVLMLVSGGSVTAIDLLAGEKERGTLETLLVSAADRQSVLLGKLLVVFSTTVVAVVMSLASVAAVSLSGVLSSGDEAWRLRIGPAELVGIGFLLVPLAAMFGILLLLLSGLARSYKEGQHYILPLVLLSFVPALASTLPGARLDSILAVIPVANAAVGIREILIGTFRWPWLLLATLVNLACSAGLLWTARSVLSRESVIVPGDATRTRERRLRPARTTDALALFAAVWLLMFFVGAPLQQRNLVSGLFYSLFGLILGPSILFLRIFPRPRAEQLLHWRAPHPAAWLSLPLLTPGLALSMAWLMRLQARLMPMGGAMEKALEETFVDNGLPLWLVVVGFALSPGFCEEVLFRGVLAGVLHRRLGTGRAVVLVGVLFGLLHFSVFRIAGTATLGMVLTWLVLRGGSLWLPMALHAAYNATMLTGARWPTTLESLTERLWSLPLGVALVAAGLVLVAHVQRDRARRVGQEAVG